MAKRSQPPFDLARLVADTHQQRLQQAANGPSGLQWFVDLRFGDPHWYRDRVRVGALVDGLASASWFRELSVIGRDHGVGVPFERIDEVRDLIANGLVGNAIFAHGEPRMTVDINEAALALSLDRYVGRMELRVWFSAEMVARYGRLVLDELIVMILGWRTGWDDTLVATALAFPRPAGGLAYRRPRPPRIAGRTLEAVVDVLDRDVPPGGPPWAHDTRAMLDAAVPDGITRIERGPVVVVRWLDNPADPAAFAEACSRHEQWAVAVVKTSIIGGWNDAGDLGVGFERAPKPQPLSRYDAASGLGYVDAPPTLDEETWSELTKLAGCRRLSTGAKVQAVALVLADRAQALQEADRARAVRFSRVLYRDQQGMLWDPFPGGDWVV